MTECSEDFKKMPKSNKVQLKFTPPNPLSGACSGTLPPMTELPGHPSHSSLMGLQVWGPPGVAVLCVAQGDICLCT